MSSGPNGDRWYDCMPLYHGTGCTVACGSIISGTTLCIGKKFSTSRFWDDIRDSRATGFVYVGETARYLLSAPETPRDRDHKVKAIFGNGLRPDVWRRFRDRFGIEIIYEFFSSSEGLFGLQNVCRGEYTAGAVGHHGAITRFLHHKLYVPVRIDHNTGDIWRHPETGFAERMPYENGGEMLVMIEDASAFVGYVSFVTSPCCRAHTKKTTVERSRSHSKEVRQGRFQERRFILPLWRCSETNSRRSMVLHGSFGRHI
jgi:acyl-CoA synthetase (AMP-forming)/AMP-acid ligase II